MAQLCLKWNNFETSIMQVFQGMYEEENLVDVTIGCERSFLKAHKVVLAACSPYFQSLFMSNPCKHPIVILKDVRFQDLKMLIEFMYHGEVTVSHEHLASLLKTAETLQIKQLAEVIHHPEVEAPAVSATNGRKKRKRFRSRKMGAGGGDTAASGDSDFESEVKKVGVQSGYQSETISGENDIAIEGTAEGAEGARILELSMAEVVDPNDGDGTEDGEAARNLVGTEIALPIGGQVEDLELDERFGQGNMCGVVTVYTGGHEETQLMLMKKKQSFVWDHFTETGKGSVKCKKCGKLLSYKDTSGSTSNMIKHLKTVHSVERAAKPPLME